MRKQSKCSCIWKGWHQRIEVTEDRGRRGGNCGSPWRGQRQKLKASVMVRVRKLRGRCSEGKEDGRGQSLSSFTELVVFEMSDGGRNKKGWKPVK